MPEKTKVLLDNIRTPIPREIAYRVSNVRLKASMEAIGELLNPIFYCDHATLPPPAVDLVEGFSRTFLARELGWNEVWGIKIDRPRDDAERELLMWSHNEVRRHLTLKEKRESVFRYMKLTGCDRDVAAARFNLVKAEKSRVFSLDLLAPGDLELLDEAGVIDSIISQIGPISPREAQIKAIDLATTPVPEGRLPSRDAWEQLRDRMMEGYIRKPGRKARQKEDVKIPKDSPIANLAIWADIDPKALAKALKDLAKVIDENAAHGLEVVLAMLRSKDRPGDGSAAVSA